MGGADRAQARSAEHGPGVGILLFYVLSICGPSSACEETGEGGGGGPYRISEPEELLTVLMFLRG